MDQSQVHPPRPPTVPLTRYFRISRPYFAHRVSTLMCPLLAYSRFLIIPVCLSLASLRLTAHIRFTSQYTFGKPCLCCGICSIPCPRLVPDTTVGIRTHGRQFIDAYGRVYNLSIPISPSQLNQVRRADTCFIREVAVVIFDQPIHISHPAPLTLNVYYPRTVSVVHINGRATLVLH